ncbi:MAG: SIMPL domain-containing protein [Gammaproteobacteria bacterium]|jgi:hypothetical protein
MQREHTGGALVLGVFILLGLAALGYLLGDAAIRFKEFERSVTVKGLAEQEYPADVVIWPIQFTLAGNDLAALYANLEENTARIQSFLQGAAIPAAEITVSAPVITDKSAQSYGGAQQPEFRYSALQTVTVYSGDVERVRGVMGRLVDLGKQGIALTGGGYQEQTEYLFTRLNEVKPAMIEEATTKAREVARKFAQDSDSRLGKIKRASQGQFTISPRDKNNPHIKQVRVVSTVEYYLSD